MLNLNVRLLGVLITVSLSTGCANSNDVGLSNLASEGTCSSPMSSGQGGYSACAPEVLSSTQVSQGNRGGAGQAFESGNVNSGGAPTTTDGTGTLKPVIPCGLPELTEPVATATGDATELQILDWAGFRGAVTYTFDDANSSQLDHYAELNALGVPMSFYIYTGKDDAKNPLWGRAVRDGHELGNHTKDHQQLADIADIEAAQAFLKETFGVRAWTFSAPFGNKSYVEPAKSLFLVNRGTGGGRVPPNGPTDPFDLPCYAPLSDATAKDVNAQIDAAVKAGSWQIVLLHGFVGGTDNAYLPMEFDEFAASVQYAKSLGTLWLDTMVNVAAYFRAQKLLSEVVPVRSGSDTVYNWTLPPNFPPGKCLRINTNAAAVSQQGSLLKSNRLGYYDIALDSGTLTLTR